MFNAVYGYVALLIDMLQFALCHLPTSMSEILRNWLKDVEVFTVSSCDVRAREKDEKVYFRRSIRTREWPYCCHDQPTAF